MLSGTGVQAAIPAVPGAICQTADAGENLNFTNIKEEMPEYYVLLPKQD